eukprot:GHVP01013538.1.p3 GENE.GHVP01013538.1~~GHVP01013538.1.p3  ORF type:complete len:324 (+),score=62.21 GHVP01013538.1:2013-2984(+)
MQGRPGGDKKGLIVGINYTGQTAELRGCTNDAHVMYKFLTDKGFPPNQILVLAEDSKWLPTKKNIINGCRWLSNNTKAGDSLFFHFSGHGTRVVDLDGDEKDGFDEAIVPLDYRETGLILDDDLFRILVKPLPRGCRLTAIMDCCHSGSGLDLAYSLKMTDESIADLKSGLELSMSKIMHHEKLKKHIELFREEVENIPYYEELFKEFGNFLATKARDEAFEDSSDKICDGEVILFSGCQDTQTSADVNNLSTFELPYGYGEGCSGGACTSAFVETIYKNVDGITFANLLMSMRRILAERGFTQIPQMTSSFKVPLREKFWIL